MADVRICSKSEHTWLESPVGFGPMSARLAPRIPPSWDEFDRNWPLIWATHRHAVQELVQPTFRNAKCATERIESGGVGPPILHPNLAKACRFRLSLAHIWSKSGQSLAASVQIRSSPAKQWSGQTRLIRGQSLAQLVRKWTEFARPLLPCFVGASPVLLGSMAMSD